MKRFLAVGIIGVLVAGISVFGIEEFKHKRVKGLEAKVFQAKTYINHGDLVNAEIMLNIIKEENLDLKDKNVQEDILEIENSIDLNKDNFSNKPIKNLDDLSVDQKNVELLNLYLENNEVSPDVRSIESAGKEYYTQFRKSKNLPLDENKDFSNKKGYILKPIKTSKRFLEDTCLIFDGEKPYYINNNIYYKFVEIPVSSYFGEEDKEIWYFADLNFNIISKENLEFYMNNKDVLDSNNNILSNYNLTNYIKDEYLY
ncbi:hypothetical protein P5E45_13430 [Clostridium perfringens]|uniref:hypothetical protein n=1 Tax=Clostridium perfringens TaxID=1502 RepID=UPI001A2183E5|nr:hypothetical protein [Clostridium perfringens]MDK0785605.1 hypothetical protein [Clostridium perfringens]MDK0847209.1 hypothetical protein [Clostridium perfringens]HAT4192094.1 hypothetical protein [Clostridium perfringens]